MTKRSDPINPKSGIQNLKVPLAARTSLKVSSAVQLHMSFRLTEGVQVRDETFGLLFYNYRGPRLYFVPSKDFIDAEFFDGRRCVDGLIAAVSARKGKDRREVAKNFTMILTKLAGKGLIYEQSIC